MSCKLYSIVSMCPIIRTLRRLRELKMFKVILTIWPWRENSVLQSHWRSNKKYLGIGLRQALWVFACSYCMCFFCICIKLLDCVLFSDTTNVLMMMMMKQEVNLRWSVYAKYVCIWRSTENVLQIIIICSMILSVRGFYVRQQLLC